MKTKDRILKASLDLFNTEGEPNVTTVDIAAAINISPGNLYYHFKGKEPIISALYDDYEYEMKEVLSAQINKPLRIDDNWIFMYIIFEEIYDFRFFYYNQVDLLHRFPTLAPRFTKLINSKKQALNQIYQNLQKQGAVEMTDEDVKNLSERSAMIFTMWPSWAQLIDPNCSVPHAINNGVYSIFSQITPYLLQDSVDFQDLLASYRDHMIRKT